MSITPGKQTALITSIATILIGVTQAYTAQITRDAVAPIEQILEKHVETERALSRAIIRHQMELERYIRAHMDAPRPPELEAAASALRELY